jgi:imidazolonepropionase-like amidohydrolase
MRTPLAALAALLAVPAVADTVVVRAAHMLDVSSGRLLAEPVILIRDSRIVDINSEVGASIAVPDDARHVDRPSLTLLPGLIDMHVHLTVNPLYGGYRGLQFTDSFWVAQRVVNARAMLESGFTTVRNLSRDLGDVGIKQAVEEGLIAGPRIVPAAHLLGSTGGHCDYGTLLPPSFRLTAPGVGDSPDQLRQRVREQRKYGAEVIKVCATGGVFSRNPGQQQLTEAELRAVADEAHMWGLKVAAHAHGADGIKAAIRAGVDTIEHASLIDDEGIRLAKERGTWQSMDIYNTEYAQAEGARNGVPEHSLRTDREIGALQRESLRKVHAAGVKMVFGTDVGGSMPHRLAARQFATMVQFGMTPMEAIQAATRNAAEALGRELDVGAIAIGRYADLIAVGGDPTRDVRLLESVDFVMKGGKIIKPMAAQTGATARGHQVGNQTRE